MNNLAREPALQTLRASLKMQLEQELTEQGDPRMAGNGGIYDDYPYMDKRTQQFYKRYMAGEELRAGWVSDTDFEKHPMD
jgi:hypothetical protein